MNILKNVFNWTIGSFFRTIGRIIAFIVIGFLIVFILQKLNIDITNIFMPSLSAATLTTKSTYTNNTNHIIGQDFSSFGSNNTFSYSTTLPNLYGEFLWENASTATAISGQAYAFSLGFQYNLTAQKYYDITINFRDRDLKSNVNTSSVELLGGTSISGMTSNNLSLIGITNTATSSNNTNKLVIRVYSVQAISYFVVQLYNMQNTITSVNNFGISSVSIVEVDITNSQAIINNQTNNTQNIINNQNDTTQQIIESNQVCKDYDSSNVSITGYTLDGSGNLVAGDSSRGIIDYINVQNSKLTLLNKTDYIGAYMCFYNTNKQLISCIATRDTALGDIQLPSNTVYLRATIYIPQNKPTFRVCQNGNQAINQGLDDINTSIQNGDTSQAQNKATEYFNNFQDNDHGLSSIITMPLNSIRLMLSDNCVAPHTIYKGKTISLPCGDILWSRQGASALKDFLNVVYGGFICYYLVRSIFMWINRFKDPDNDKIEVIDL